MARLIQTSDGVLIEVEAEAGDYQLCSASSADKVQKSLNQIKPLLAKACGAVKDFWNEQREGIQVEQVEVEFGLNFEGEGNAYIARAKAGGVCPLP
jgi:hypothetical protein